MTRGPRVVNKATKKEMKKILREIQNGKFARQWIAENNSGRKKYNKLMKADLHAQDREGRRPSCASACPGCRKRKRNFKRS